MNFTIPTTGSYDDLGTFTFRRRLPLFTDCPILPPLFFTDESNAWNCVRCNGESEFCIPFKSGDVIPIQLNVQDEYNSDPENPTTGFKKSNTLGNAFVAVSVLDEECNVVTSNIDSLANDYWVAWFDGKGSFQTFFLDTSLLPVDLEKFQICIEYRNSDGDVYLTVFSEPFCKCSICKSTINIASTYEKNDCFGRCYLEPETYIGSSNRAFYASIRLKASFEYVGETQSITTNDIEVVVLKEIQKRYLLKSSLMPPYYASMLSAVIFGDIVEVDGIEFDFSASVIDRNNDLNRMFVVDVEASTTCELSKFDCD